MTRVTSDMKRSISTFFAGSSREIAIILSASSLFVLIRCSLMLQSERYAIFIELIDSSVTHNFVAEIAPSVSGGQEMASSMRDGNGSPISLHKLTNFGINSINWFCLSILVCVRL